MCWIRRTDFPAFRLPPVSLVDLDEPVLDDLIQSGAGTRSTSIGRSRSTLSSDAST